MKACLWWLSSILQWTGDLKVCFWKDQVQIWSQLLIFFLNMLYGISVQLYQFLPFSKIINMTDNMTFLKGEHGKIQKCKHVSKRCTLCCLFFQVVFGECFLLVSMGLLCSFNLLCVLWDDSGRFLLVNIFQLLLIFIINDVPVNTLICLCKCAWLFQE